MPISKNPFLPVLPLIIKYPFLRISGVFLEYFYGELLDVLKKKDGVVETAMDIGKQSIESILRNRKLDVRGSLQEYFQPEYYESFLCTDCDIRCYRECKTDFVSKECFSCSECFKNCEKDIPYEHYHKRVTYAKMLAIGYLYSKILVSNLDEWVGRRFAVNFAESFRQTLESESLEVLKMIADDLNIDVNISKDISVHVTTFLKVSVKMRAKEWRLINRLVRKGRVNLSKGEFVRVIVEFLRDRFLERYEDFDLNNSPELREIVRIKKDLEDLRTLSEKVRKKMPKISMSKINTSEFPPCMRRILSDLQSGVNIPHSARFALTSFLLNLGMDVEEVVSLYKMAPDFDEEKTRYQVNHIAGAKGTEYYPPSCDTMKTYHNCYDDGTCKNVYHPLQYISQRSGER